MVREHPDGSVEVAIADPTTTRDTVTVLLRGRPLRAVSTAPGLQISRTPGGTRVRATTRHLYGATLSALLR
jgi:hyaluronate lyase